MSHIFISYSHQDSDYAHRLAAELERRNLVPWIDDRIDYGTAWPDVIEQHIDTCVAFIVVLTPRSKDSLWVKNELAYAMGLGKPIFPLLLEGNFWLSVAAIQCLDVRNGRLPSKRFYDRLAQFVLPVARQPFEPEMILIAAGDFLMGSDPRKDKDARGHEKPQHHLYLPDYYIGRTPVTNAQYLAFVEDTGYSLPAHWDSEGLAEGLESHPVVGVGWSDVMAYCRWLSETTGRSYRLPSEAQWEKAARGTDGRTYPWGDQWDAKKCNTIEGGKGSTTPVEAYPDGASPYGLLDVAGNVWEWTRSLNKNYPYDPKDGREEKPVSDDMLCVLRGGAFFNSARSVRCAVRNSVLADFWCLGFRICAES